MKSLTIATLTILVSILLTLMIIANFSQVTSDVERIDSKLTARYEMLNNI